MTSNSEFWDTHYSHFKEGQATPFAKFVQRGLQGNEDIVELGCGNGRDAQLLSAKSRSYFGLDSSKEAILLAQQNISKSENKIANSSFINVDFLKMHQIINHYSLSNLLIYSRFSLHSITEGEELLLFEQLRSLESGTRVALEVRTIYDPWFGIGEKVGRNAFHSDHFRRFIVPSELVESLSRFCNISTISLGTNLARYKEEDPRVLRIEAVIF